MAPVDLRQSPMMAYLLHALANGQDIGHYGRLTVAIVGSYFLSRDDLVQILLQGSGADAGEVKALVLQASKHRYNPPSRAQILEWQQHQDFPLCTTPDDPDACNLYRDLRFPDAVYADIEAYREQRSDAAEAKGAIQGAS